jgi:hypothetical protein
MSVPLAIQARFYAGARGPRPPVAAQAPPVSFNALSRWNWIARNRVGSGDQAPRIFGLEPRLFAVQRSSEK